ncbi:DUF1217 domain-containing protein [Loktanella sp. M215]|uniref:DUF1217 domain-containing protein n=1 Tax=Loktanella sp. M215 TaxID=2675431 RepID=UPI001F319FD0|nr:DUF1217 domain-containing protein [Loktanella sp. M215]MCF7698851.1 DUF1217 domain-containing protein [Loktanella sp. M215]
MSFQPILPFGGYAGWSFLQRTLPKQQDTFNNSAPVKRATDQFREKIAGIRTADDLMADRQVLQVALGAFGLDDDINNTFFIKKILTDGTTSSTALSSRLADKRYAAFSSAFGFGAGDLPRTGQAAFAETITGLYEKKQFERAVGEQDNDLRSALNLSSGLSDIVANNGSNNARWFAIMGNAPVRAVVETALGLPSSIARIDLDQQLDTFKSRAQSVFGTDKVGDLTAPDQQTKMVRLFLIRSEAAAAAQTSAGSIALSLLQSAGYRR